jgi:hypothetical protein
LVAISTHVIDFVDIMIIYISLHKVLKIFRESVNETEGSEEDISKWQHIDTCIIEEQR